MELRPVESIYSGVDDPLAASANVHNCKSRYTWVIGRLECPHPSHRKQSLVAEVVIDFHRAMDAMRHEQRQVRAILA